MTEAIADTHNMATPWCPVCNPERDPITEILETRWCEYHRPPNDGDYDRIVSSHSLLAGSSEVEGESNKKWCDMLHRASTS